MAFRCWYRKCLGLAVLTVITLGTVPSGSAQEVTVPNVIGLTENDARNSIAAAGLVVGNVSRPVWQAPAGIVIGQNGLPGTTEPPGSAVDLIISLGGVMVPDLLGVEESEARAEIAALGLIASVSHQKLCINPDEVFGEAPLGGTLVAPGSTVRLRVDSGTLRSCGVLK